MEQKAIYDAINFNYSYDGGTATAFNTNSTASLSRVASFLCPSDGQAGKSFINSYCGSIGTTIFRDGSEDNVAQSQVTSGLFA